MDLSPFSSFILTRHSLNYSQDVAQVGLFLFLYFGLGVVIRKDFRNTQEVDSWGGTKISSKTLRNIAAIDIVGSAICRDGPISHDRFRLPGTDAEIFLL